MTHNPLSQMATMAIDHLADKQAPKGLAQVKQFFHDIKNITLGLLLGVITPLVLYFLGAPPLLQFRAGQLFFDYNWWWTGVLALGYLSWLFFWIGFVLQDDITLQTVIGDTVYQIKGNKGLVAYLVAMLGWAIIHDLGAPGWLLWPSLVLQLGALLAKGQGELGRNVFYHLSNMTLLATGLWMLLLGEIM